MSVARANAAENGVAGVVSAAVGSPPHPEVRDGGYDLVLANISAKVVMELAGPLSAAARPGGALVLSGFLLKDEEAVRSAYAAEGGAVEGRREDGDWVTLRVRMP